MWDLLTAEFLGGAGLVRADEEAVAHQALASMLEHHPDVALPAVLHLTSPAVADPGLLVDLRQRLSL